MNNVVNLLQQYISNGQLEKALVECKKAIDSNVNDPYLQKVLSHIYNLQENYNSALEVSKNLLLKHPNDFDCLNNIGHFYMKLEEYDLASDFINRAKSCNPDHPSPYQNQSDIYVKLRDFENAMIEINKCIALHEKYSSNYEDYKSTLLLKIELFIAQKKQNDAIDFIQKYLSIKFDGELLFQLIQISKKNANESLIHQCLQEISHKNYSSKLDKFKKLVPLYFALAYFYEKNNQKLSEEYFIKGNKEVSEIQRLTMLKFQKSTLTMIKNYETIKDIELKDKNKGHKNIFILGMPRSGTTLTESILTANDEVFGAGELMSFYDLAFREIINEDSENKNFEKVGDDYVRRTSFFINNGNKVVDKLPNNFLFIGQIRKFLPKAKIILLQRDPWDVAISLFKQRYVANISFASSFFNIGIQMSNFEASIVYWQKSGMIDDHVMILNYEDLVQNTDKYQKEIYKFCNIESQYQPEIREKFFARTASVNQVQNKIHSESVKKNDFADQKSEFLDAFFSQRSFWHSKGIIDDTLGNFFDYPMN